VGRHSAVARRRGRDVDRLSVFGRRDHGASSDLASPSTNLTHRVGGQLGLAFENPHDRLGVGDCRFAELAVGEGGPILVDHTASLPTHNAARIVAVTTIFDQARSSHRRPTTRAVTSWLIPDYRGSGFGPVAVTRRGGTQSSTWTKPS